MTDEAKDKFLAWCDARGIFISPKLDLFSPFTFEELTSSRSMKQYMEPEENKLPIGSYVTPPSIAENVEKGTIQSHLKSHKPPLSNFSSMSVYLMHEFATESSALSPYIEILPQEYSNSLYLSDDQKEGLKGTTLGSMIEQDFFERQFTKSILPIVESYKNWPTNGDENLIERFRRAAGTVMSRGFHDGEGRGPFILPVVDMFNHSCVFPNISLKEDNGVFIVVAREFIGRDTEKVFNSYGELSNTQLMHTYGFVEEDNPHDSVDIPIDCMVEQYRESGEESEDKSCSASAKIEVLRDAKLISERGFQISKEDMLPSSLITTAQVLLMDDEAFEEYRKDPIELGEDMIGEEGADDYLVAVYSLVLSTIEARMTSYGVSFRDTYLQLKDPKLEEAQRSICVLRFSEQTMLLNLKSQLKEEIDEIVGETQPKPVGNKRKTNEGEKKKQKKQRR
ncbi:N-lysine methyltransferase SETD6-like [Planoprotostelium fungivorum]|uniref:N-lysine methyltransferase SETD6-like n=1 Tax=Planoprotostelium fungivorum TaxID=1890364 RepID=A0A2P6NSG0_9EUKA|nr:N-lysine methyltransferase SETD6-like [Planoprotostelium fungivorum]